MFMEALYSRARSLVYLVTFRLGFHVQTGGFVGNETLFSQILKFDDGFAQTYAADGTTPVPCFVGLAKFMFALG